MKEFWRLLKDRYLYEYHVPRGLQTPYIIIDYLINTTHLCKLTRKNIFTGKKEIYYKGKWCELVEHQITKTYKSKKHGKWEVKKETEIKKIILV